MMTILHRSCRSIQDGDGSPAIPYQLTPFLSSGSGSSARLRGEEGEKASLAASAEAAQAMHRGCQMTLTLLVPLWIVNATSLSIAAGLVPLADEKEFESMMDGFFDGGAAAREMVGSRVYTKLKTQAALPSSGGLQERAVGDLRLMDTEAPSSPSSSSSTTPSGHVTVLASSVEMMGPQPTPPSSFDSFSGGSSGLEERPQGITLRIMGSKWTLPIALPSISSSQQSARPDIQGVAQAAESKLTSPDLLSSSQPGDKTASASLSSFQSYEPVLIRARSLSDGSIYEVVARFTSASALSHLDAGSSTFLSSLPSSSASALTRAAGEAGGSCLVLRLEAHLVVSNLTGYPLHLIQPYLNPNPNQPQPGGAGGAGGGGVKEAMDPRAARVLKLKPSHPPSALHWSSSVKKRLMSLSLPSNQVVELAEVVELVEVVEEVEGGCFGQSRSNQSTLVESICRS